MKIQVLKQSMLLKNSSIIKKISKNTKLHPAIITACKDHFELDMYLKCLNNNELDKIQLFDIQFKVRPSKKSDVCTI